MPGKSTAANARKTAGEPDWQAAQERVLLYLKTLGVLPVQSLEIALEALSRAVEIDSRSEPDTHPTRSAMNTLHQLLAKHSFLRPENNMPVMPPINRAVMLSAKLEPYRIGKILTFLFTRRF